jgi:hypothetical protein
MIIGIADFDSTPPEGYCPVDRENQRLILGLADFQLRGQKGAAYEATQQFPQGPRFLTNDPNLSPSMGVEYFVNFPRWPEASLFLNQEALQL